MRSSPLQTTFIFNLLSNKTLIKENVYSFSRTNLQHYFILEIDRINYFSFFFFFCQKNNFFCEEVKMEYNNQKLSLSNTRCEKEELRRVSVT